MESMCGQISYTRARWALDKEEEIDWAPLLIDGASTASGAGAEFKRLNFEEM
jgi:hypothetical protein